MVRCTMRDILKVSRVLDDNSVFFPINGHHCTIGEEGSSAYGLLARQDIVVLMPNEGSVVAFIPYNQHIFNVHMAFLPEWRGKLAKYAMLDSFSWVFENTSCRKIMGMEDSKNKAALRFCSMLGERQGLLNNVDGKGTDMVIFGRCKP